MFRTPKKPDTLAEEMNRTVTLEGAADLKKAPTTSSVRRSIGEWETGKPDQSRTNLTPPQNRATTTGLSQKPVLAARRMSAELRGSPPASVKKADRILEARAWLNKAKQHIANSRNLKSEIKAGVLEATDQLYRLVKEASAAKVQTSAATASRQPEDPRKEETKEREEERKEKKVENLTEILEQHTLLMKESNERMENLKEMLANKLTYASAVASTPHNRLPERTALHSVVVTARNETETGEEVLNRIRKVINAKEGGVAVERIRKARDRKVIIGCRTEEERKRIKDKITGAPELNVEDVKNKDPMVILRNVLQHNSDEDVLKALKNQNKSVFQDLDEQEKRAEIAFKKRTRNPHTSHVVLRVSTKLWQRLLGTGAVHIDLQRVKVEDQSPLVQCSLCLGYGHGRRFCTEKVEKCSHCGGPHMKAQCADWLAGTTPSCCNCTHAKLDHVEHNAFSSECQVRRKWDALAREAIAYC